MSEWTECDECHRRYAFMHAHRGEYVFNDYQLVAWPAYLSWDDVVTAVAALRRDIDAQHSTS